MTSLFFLASLGVPSHNETSQFDNCKNRPLFYSNPNFIESFDLIFFIKNNNKHHFNYKEYKNTNKILIFIFILLLFSNLMADAPDGWVTKRLAVAIAILILYIVHYITMAVNHLLGKGESKQYINRRVYLFGIAGI